MNHTLKISLFKLLVWFRLGSICFCAFMILILTQCANPVSPTGGPRDKVAPGIDSTKSTPNYSTNFSSKQIILTFDEWVRLNDAFNQVVISPPLEEELDIRLNRKKGVVVGFNEELRPNTTYTLNFGEAVKDITEGNAAKNLRYVFSTGAFIDSLSFEGQVVNIYSGASEAGMLVMMYDNLEDSVVYKEKPLYFSKTDQNGKFRIENMKAGTFKVFALRDNNYNYLFDLENEVIGFNSKTITITDSTDSRLLIKTFEEEIPFRILSTNTRTYGQIKLTLTQEDQGLNISVKPSYTNYFVERKEKEIRIWYDTESEEEIQFFAEINNYKDTINVSPTKRADYLKANPKLKFIPKPSKEGEPNRRGGNRNNAITSSTTRGNSGRPGSTTGKRGGTNTSTTQSTSSSPVDNAKAKFNEAVASLGVQKINPDRPVLLYLNHPVINLEKEDFEFLNDSTKQIINPSYTLLEDNRTLSIKHTWKEGAAYRLKIKEGAMKDLFGLENDSLEIPFVCLQRKDMGTILCEISGMDSTKQYLVTLLDSKQEPIEKFNINNLGFFKKNLTSIEPGEYTIRVVEDDNKNGKWDSGNYLGKRQPERVTTKKLQTLRANWELEAFVQIGVNSLSAVGNSGK